MKNNFIKRVVLKNNQNIYRLIGKHDEYLNCVEEIFKVKIVIRENGLVVEGREENVNIVDKLYKGLDQLLNKGYAFQDNDIKYAVRMLYENNEIDLKDIFLDVINVSLKKKYITPKSLTQKKYINLIKDFDIVFGIGPAGTGKTYLAMAMAVSALLKKEVSRIILVRPAVEAGEKLGYLPGSLYEKIHPYLRPLYDALYEMMETEKVRNLIEKDIIEIAPLAYMRGRTLNDSFIILDEAQNTTTEQMKMFLTRLGFNSRVVVTGDITQVDLPSGKISGLIEVQSILSPVEGIKFVYFSERDVVRHDLVQKIIKAYDGCSSNGEPKG